MARRVYTDEQRAAALAALKANGGNLNKTARDTGIPRKTIEHWLPTMADGGETVAKASPPEKKPDPPNSPISPESPAEKKGPNSPLPCGLKELIPQAEATLADRCHEIAERALGLVGKKLDELSGKDLMTVAGIAIDKEMLLRGQGRTSAAVRLMEIVFETARVVDREEAPLPVPSIASKPAAEIIDI